MVVVASFDWSSAVAGGVVGFIGGLVFAGWVTFR